MEDTGSFNQEYKSANIYSLVVAFMIFDWFIFFSVKIHLAYKLVLLKGKAHGMWKAHISV